MNAIEPITIILSLCLFVRVFEGTYTRMHANFKDDLIDLNAVSTNVLRFAPVNIQSLIYINRFINKKNIYQLKKSK